MTLCAEIKRRIEKQLSGILALRREKKKKGDGTYVTQGDLLCEKIIIEYIKSASERFEIISEEKRVDDFFYDPVRNYVVIDPIDGTENFTSGLKEWGIAVCIYRRGAHSESLLLMPELDLSLMTGDAIEKFTSRIHGLSSKLKKEHFRKLKNGFEYRITGCSVYNLYNVIKGAYASLEHPGAQVWDILAGLNLAREHGLAVAVNGASYKGKFLDPREKHRFKITSAHA